ncbi:hypothetical protein G6F57_021787 [Rhizopus arrhizus]|nr:hypothetical protein G6F57_021787 [Rhizopus arrhizus]
MAKNSIDAYGASGKSNVLFFKPEDLVMVTDRTHPLFDERVFLPLNEAMVLNIKDQGVIQPISVWKDPELGQTLVVAGRQRVKHTMEANRRLEAEGAKPLLVPGRKRDPPSRYPARPREEDGLQPGARLRRGGSCAPVWMQCRSRP